MGWDYKTGVTNGKVYQYIDNEIYDPVYHIDDKQCERISLGLKLPMSFNQSSSTNYTMYLVSVAPTNGYTEFLKKTGRNDNIHYTQLTYEIKFNLSCPPGFYYDGGYRNCSCLFREVFHNCTVRNYNGYLSWKSTMWVSSTYSGGIVYAELCPFDYCISEELDLNLMFLMNTSTYIMRLTCSVHTIELGNCVVNVSRVNPKTTVWQLDPLNVSNVTMRVAWHSSYSLQLQDSCWYSSSIFSTSL